MTMLAPDETRADARPVWIVGEDASDIPDHVSAWLEASGFEPELGAVSTVPADGADGPAGAAVALGDPADPFALGALAGKLPSGDWFVANPAATDIDQAMLGFCMGAYRFDRYRKASSKRVRLVPDKTVDRARLEAVAGAVSLTRDLVNTPANDMGPDAIEAATRALAAGHKAVVKTITGEELIAKKLPMIHAVGRASATPPRLIDLRWGKKSAPKLTLVGKGVSFDTGGLGIKPSTPMRNMKKDMGGAANVLGLAAMIMKLGLEVRLRVLVPAVENAISGNAFRPGDVYPTRKGLTVEIGHTDAEGRLVLADALALADEEEPDLIIDMATLTGAARVALGPDIVPFYTDDDTLAGALAQAAETQRDPLWRMPLWQPYARGLSSTVADCANVTADGFAGSVTAALFLRKFVSDRTPWLHLDLFAWTPKPKPHAPVGGEAQAIRALFSVLEARYGGG
ncbi:MAG: leucyl aminopeptidase family protein [Roseitalea sp.]|nr:leucyl aminopeptidase family protein [Roseitalea sp.]MBO6722920.1 leucyl aminopeptidase family protein [Roseitalea sp.]MBO6745046.1 leucyl aminopeptidase family protein [Roseitalea sp.]